MTTSRRRLFGILAGATVAPSAVLAGVAAPVEALAYGRSVGAAALPDIRVMMRMQAIMLQAAELAVFPPKVVGADGSIDDAPDRDLISAIECLQKVRDIQNRLERDYAYRVGGV